ncbi:hypothetical protein FE783_33205 [Paenibacillus mesophilus]|uniref:hypothetical protein n=1 Tax=Paenibacillus mesophilus TaxID=2582849 RepID=UPI00110E7345|nr:hypothetical protein [Paenibacillus mesophilus]TMV44218.1 hypothetical protein FE783_33205 [Paenibacillus mesophilus]
MKRLNIGSFLLTLLCGAAACVASFTPPVFPLNFHYFILGASAIVFVLSVMGLGGVSGWKAAARSVFSIVACVCLILFEAVVLVLGNLMT